MTRTLHNTNDDPASKRSRQKRLGDQLKRLYDDVVEEPIPDEFMKLLEEADHKKSGQSSASDKANPNASDSGDN